MAEKRTLRVKPSKQKHYVDNKLFYAAMLKYAISVETAQDDKQPHPRIPEYIGECFVAMAHKIANRPNFMNYPFKEEMIAFALERCIRGIDSFNPHKYTNPFAYFSRVIHCAFLRTIYLEKRYLYTKYTLADERLLHENSEDNSSTVNKYGHALTDNNMREFMEDFEVADKNKRAKQKTSKPTTTKISLDTFMSKNKDDE